MPILTSLLDSAGLHQSTEHWQNEAMIVVLTKCEARETPFFGFLSLSDLDKDAEYHDLRMRGG